MTGRMDVVEAARGWLGTPYRHQASCLGAGADCLGLIRGLWRTVVGPEPVLPPAYSMDWGEYGKEELLWRAALAWLKPVEPEPLCPGQVLLFRMREGAVAKHLGVVSKVGPEATFIHAYSGHGVVESPLSDPWRRRIVAVFAFPEGTK